MLEESQYEGLKKCNRKCLRNQDERNLEYFSDEIFLRVKGDCMTRCFLTRTRIA
jgi:hypothetical protein